MIDITIDMNVKDLDKDLVDLLYRLGQKTVERFLHRAGAIATASVRKTLAAGGRPGAWAPLAASTLERRGRAAREGLSFRERRADSTVPLGGKGGTFYKSIRRSLYNFGHAIRVYPPEKKMGFGKKSLAQLMKIHETGGHSPVRKAFFLQPEDIESIMVALGLTVDEAIHGKRRKMKSLGADVSAPMGRFGGQLAAYAGKRGKSIRRTVKRARRTYRRTAKSILGKKGLVPRLQRSLFGKPSRRRK